MSFSAEPIQLDTTGLKCPLLFVRVKQQLKQLNANQTLKVLVCDSVALADIKRYLNNHAYRYTLLQKEGNTVEINISKDAD